MGNMPPHMSPGMPPHMSPGAMLQPGMATMPPPGMMNMMEMPPHLMQQNPHAMQMPMPGMNQGWDHWRAMQGHPQMPHVTDAPLCPQLPCLSASKVGSPCADTAVICAYSLRTTWPRRLRCRTCLRWYCTRWDQCRRRQATQPMV